ncbi:glycosyltransferase family 4 protein [Mycobacterium sp. IDR2000157661]|uniref:glycosyltransferase family 4 protein n=1 Tax=Mycobacterium sp. IDR2000157661 TaxID=2867005 RepID=UPI001EEACD5F|nr:glycosyltransferase family 4 protein [Mycobacterium sp. IDR2000157661]ULE33958.1 glycosyltransferase family 4 protein [Mycobacterium sp. IDR2000157661]
MSKIHFLVVVPPPTTGMTLASLAMAEKFEQLGEIEIERRYVSAAHGQTGLRWGLRKHLALLRRYPWTSRGALYVVVDSGRGMIGTLVLIALARVQGRRILAHHHAWSYLGRENVVLSLLVRVGGKRTMHIVLSDSMARALRFAGSYPARTQVVSNAGLISPPDMTDAPAETTGRRVKLGMLGNLTLDKGVDVAVSTLRALESEGIAATLTLAGPIAKDADEYLSAQPAANLERVGPLQDRAKFDYLRQLDLLLFPSRYANEAQPLVIWEALAVGTPVIATAVGAIPELADTGGLCIVPSDRAFSEAVIDVLRGDIALIRSDARASYSRAACDTVSSIEKLADVIVDKQSARPSRTANELFHRKSRGLS